MTDLGRIPGLRRAIGVKRRFEGLLTEVNTRVQATQQIAADDASAFDELRRDHAVMLETLTEMLPLLSEQQRRLDALTASFDSLRGTTHDLVAGLRADVEAVAADIARLRAEDWALVIAAGAERVEAAIRSAVDAADRHQADRLDTLRQRVDEATGRRLPHHAESHTEADRTRAATN